MTFWELKVDALLARLGGLDLPLAHGCVVARARRVASAACFQEDQEAGLLVTGARFQQMLRFWDWA